MTSRPAERGLLVYSDYAASGRSAKCPINQIFNLTAKIEGGRRDQLRHKNDVEIFDGVDPEQRRGQTAPIKIALANRP